MARKDNPEDFAILNEKEKEALAKEAEREVEAELKERVAKDFKKSVRQEVLTQLQGERMRGEPVEEVYLDLPTFAQVQGYGKVILDGKGYDHGRTHKVPKSVADVLREQMRWAWRHDAEIKGQTNPVEYRRRGINRVSMGGRA